MPINATVFYYKAEQEYHDAENTQQRIKALRKMLATAPTHKGAERLRADIKKRMSQLKYRGEAEKKVAKRKSISVPKVGAAQVIFIGLPNSGNQRFFPNYLESELRLQIMNLQPKNRQLKQ